MVAAEKRPMEAIESVVEDIDDERQGRARWVYKLYEMVRWLPPGPDRMATINRVASARNISGATIDRYLMVPERLPLDLLAQAFPGPDGCAWHVGLTWSHLEKASQAGGNRFAPEQRAEWLTHAADEEQSLDQFTDWLRATGAIRSPKRGSRFTPEDGAREAEVLTAVQAAASLLKAAVHGDKGDRVQEKALRFLQKNMPLLTSEAPMPKTAMTFLEALADAARTAGIDVPLPKPLQAGKAYSIAKTLRSVADLLDQQRPGAEFSIGTQGDGGDKP